MGERVKHDGLKSNDLHTLKATHALPLPKINPMMTPLKGFVRGATEHGTLPNKRTTEGFDPNAYRLLAKAGYDFKGPDMMGSVQGGHNQGIAVKQSKSRPGLGYQQELPVRITLKSRRQVVDTCTTTVRVIIEEADHTSPKSRSSVFAQIDVSSSESTQQDEMLSRPRHSVFDRLEEPCQKFKELEGAKPLRSLGTVFDRIGRYDLKPRKSVFKRLGVMKKPSVFQRLERTSQSKEPMTLKKECQVIIRTHEREPKEMVAEDTASCSSHHVTISKEAKSDLADDEIEDAPPVLEDGGQATIDELKEVNLGTIDDPRPIFVSALLT